MVKKENAKPAKPPATKATKEEKDSSGVEEEKEPVMLSLAERLAKKGPAKKQSTLEGFGKKAAARKPRKAIESSDEEDSVELSDDGSSGAAPKNTRGAQGGPVKVGTHGHPVACWGRGGIEVCSYNAPPGRGWGEDGPSQFLVGHAQATVGAVVWVNAFILLSKECK